MHYAMRHGGYAAAIKAFADAFLNKLQGGGVRMLGIQFHRKRLHAGFAEIRCRPADTLNLAVPERRARQWVGINREYCELDA